LFKNDSEKAYVFGYPVNITTRKKAVNFIVNCMEKRQGIHIVTINPEIIAAADKNPELAKILKEAEFVIPDSAGIMLAVRSLGITETEKIPGIEFSEELMKKCAKKGFKVAFLGGNEDTIELLNIEINKMFPGINIVFLRHGYFQDNESKNISGKLAQAEPHLLFVGMGVPKQEFFIKNNKKILNKTVMIGVGGSFDIWTKKVRRAPVLFRTFGLEWFYRLITQPKRFSRMFPVLPLFFLRIVFDRKNLKLS